MTDNEEIMQTRLTAARQLSRVGPALVREINGFAWSQSYRLDVTRLLAERDTLREERDQRMDDLRRESLRTEMAFRERDAAEARVEALEQALREIAGHEPYEDSPTGWMRKVARAALTRSGGDER